MQPNVKGKVLKWMIIFFTAVLIIAGCFMGKYYYDMSRDRANFAKLTQIHDDVEKEEYSYDKLKAANEDFAGWLYIDGTNIDYPVMYTPDEPEYYLRRSFQGQYSRSGVPFIDGQCTLKSNNLVIHGHNMKNGTMFSELLKYDSEDFSREHQFISFQDMDGENTYQVIAAFYTKIYGEGQKDVFRYYDYFGDLTETQLEEYLKNIQKLSLYPAQGDFTAEDTFLTLSTCAYQTDDGRFVVVAKKISDE